MDVDEYDQYELFQEIQGLQPYWDKCQWLKDPLFRRLTSDIVALPNTEDWVTTWFSSEELLEESLPLDVSFHDPVPQPILQALSHSPSRQLDSQRVFTYSGGTSSSRRRAESPLINISIQGSYALDRPLHTLRSKRILTNGRL